MRAISLRGPTRRHAAPITHVAFSLDGRALASSSYDGSVVIWRHWTNKLEPAGRIVHRRLVNASSWSPYREGLLATASADKTVGLWRVDPSSGHAASLGRLARHTDDVNAVAWLPDGERLVSASEDSTALLWDVGDGRFLGRVHAHSGHCMDIAVSAMGAVLTVGEDGEVFCGDVDRPSRAARRSFTTSIEGCAWSPDGSRAALACDDGVVRIVSPDLDLIEEHQVASSAARSVAFAADGSGRLVVGSYDASVLVLDGGATVAVRRGGRLWPRSLDTHGSSVAVGSFGTTPALLALEDLTPRDSTGDGDTYGPNALARTGRSLAVALDAGLVVSLPLDSLVRGSADGATTIRVSDDPVLALAAYRGGLFASTYGGAVHRTGEHGRGAISRVALGAPVPSLAASPDGAIVLAGTYGGDVAVLSPEATIAIEAVHHAHDGSVKSIAWRSPDQAVTAATDCTVRTFSANGPGAILWRHGNLVNAVATDARGLVASAGRDRLVRVGLPGEVPTALLGGDESMKAVALLGEESTAVVLGGSYDFSLYAWLVEAGAARPDARAGEVVFEADQAISAMLAVDSTTVVVASWDQSCRAVEWRGGRFVVHDPVMLGELADPAAAPIEEFADGA